MPPMTAGRYELVTRDRRCRSTSSPSTRTSTSPRRATRCRRSRSCRASRRPTPRARSATGCRRSCSSAARCRGSATPPAAPARRRRRGSRWSWWPRARPSCPAATPVAECVTPGTTLLDRPDDKDVEQGLYLAVTETVREEDLPLRAGPAAARPRARGRRQRHRAGQRRRRRLARRGAGQPAAGVRHGHRQAGALHGLPGQRRGPARRAAAAAAAGADFRVRAGAGLDACSRRPTWRAGPTRR